ncbi:MAG: acylneuraminate cytidylyltransferase family protein [Nitrospinota bacterium]|jgi:CMP-N-acetylneuraminic acid synthetase|nr:acylneuraminate cytidylyltransferase family protein [Nitrospinota bacterium]MDP7371008.1 acylneuraminate cytidylyltransferase family protein [Nitrospinota bacterium]
MQDMERTPRSLGVIPARGGSKRLPRKNVLSVGGKPLIAHTIEAALQAKNLTDFLVTTEDDEILKVAQDFGAPTPFKRSPHLSGDNVRNNETIEHALLFMEEKTGERYDIVVLLQPTVPIRSGEHIDQAVKLLWESDLPALASVKGPFKKRDPVLKRLRDNVLEPYRDESEGDSREAFYIYNASIYAIKRDYFLREKKFVSDKQVPLIMDEYHSADIDTESDVLVVEAFMKHLGRL